jgi:hypothetical protein
MSARAIQFVKFFSLKHRGAENTERENLLSVFPVLLCSYHSKFKTFVTWIFLTEDF